MVRVGFVVEGDCEEILIKSSYFHQLAVQYHLKICQVVNTRGRGNLCPKNISTAIANCRLANPDKILVLTDLECEPCITVAKEHLGKEGVNQIVVAKKALEAWFLADTNAMRTWLQNDEFPGELMPEETTKMPWEHLKELARHYHQKGRGPGTRKKRFAKIMINQIGFSIERAANHPNCPSAKYFLAKLQQLSPKNF
jgi:hypothetical protein